MNIDIEKIATERYRAFCDIEQEYDFESEGRLQNAWDNFLDRHGVGPAMESGTIMQNAMYVGAEAMLESIRDSALVREYREPSGETYPLNTINDIADLPNKIPLEEVLNSVFLGIMAARLVAARLGKKPSEVLGTEGKFTDDGGTSGSLHDGEGNGIEIAGAGNEV